MGRSAINFNECGDTEGIERMTQKLRALLSKNVQRSAEILDIKKSEVYRKIDGTNGLTIDGMSRIFDENHIEIFNKETEVCVSKERYQHMLNELSRLYAMEAEK